MIRKFMKKPVIVYAVKWSGKNFKECKTFCNSIEEISDKKLKLFDDICEVNDYIVKFDDINFYLWKNKTFKFTFVDISDIIK